MFFEKKTVFPTKTTAYPFKYNGVILLNLEKEKCINVHEMVSSTNLLPNLCVCDAHLLPEKASNLTRPFLG